MIDFSTVKSFSIPEGTVKRITIGGVRVWEKPGEEFTFPEYIQLDGSQYFDTGIICNQETKMELIFTREADDARYLFGVASTDNKASFTGYQSGVNSGSWRFGGAYGRPAVSVNTKHTVVVSKTGVVMDGQKQSYAGTVGTFQTPQTLIIGGCNSASGTVGTVRHIGKIYGFRLWDGDEVVMDCVPCVSSDGVAGFYDHVSLAFIPVQE
jgi:hypothetical protein